MASGELYRLLGVTATATPEEIAAAYREAQRQVQQHAGTAAEIEHQLQQLANAYAILSDAEQRAAYDATLTAPQATLPLLTAHLTYSSNSLAMLDEPQVLYLLVELTPTLSSDIPHAPLNLCLVLDRSTSMQGSRLDQVKNAVLKVIDSLQPNDIFSVIAFSDRPEVIVSAQSAQGERTIARAKVSTLNAHGSTEILQGLLCGLTEMHPHLNSTTANHLILLTDGRTYGDEDDCLMLARLAADDGVVIHGLGIGEEWNDKFLDELTAATGGTAQYISAPKQVLIFMQEVVRGVSTVYADRITLTVQPARECQLMAAFKILPEAGPLAINDWPVHLGSLPKNQSLSIMLKFLVPAITATEQINLAQLHFQADILGLGRRGEQLLVDVNRPISRDPSKQPPPPALLSALSKMAHYTLQERAWQEASAGNIASAAQRLQTLSTRLLATGQTDLAKLTLSEARRLESTHVISEESKKRIKYGTRALIAPSQHTS